VGAGSNYERRFCPIGQGFMLEGAAAAAAPVNATMSNTFRVYQKEGAANYSQFERSNLNPIIRDGIQLETQAEASHFLPEIPSVSGFDYTTVSTDPVPQIRFNTLLNNQGVRQVALAFVHSATDGADFAMDAKSPDTTADTDMYFVIDNEAYVIDVIAFDLNKRIPVGFKSATPALFRIQVGEMLNFSGAANVYLYDKETGLYHDILNKDYEMTLPAGATNRRFEITFLNGMLSIPSLDANSFLIMQNNSAKMLSISNPNEFDLKSVSVFDIGGKLVFNHLNLGNNLNYQSPTATLSDGVYVVKVTTRSNQEFNQKIAVYSGN